MSIKEQIRIVEYLFYATQDLNKIDIFEGEFDNELLQGERLLKFLQKQNNHE